MIRDTRYIFKRILIGVGIALSLFYLKSCNVYAMGNDYNVYINNSLLNYDTRLYTAGGASNNMTLKINESSTAQLDYSAKNYFYVALCSAVGDSQERYINFLNAGSYITDLRVVNSTTGCTIPNIDAYHTSARVVYFTFRVKDSNIDCGATGPCALAHPVTFQWYQPASNEFSLVSYGMSTEEFNFTSEINPAINIMNNKWNEEINKLADIWGVSQQQLAEAQVQTGWEKRIAEASEAMHQAINDDNIDTNDQDSKINTIKNSGYNNASISDIILLPVKVLQSGVNGLSSNSCSPINLGNLYNTDLILPCISNNDMQGWLSSTLYALIDVLMSFCVILGIRKLVIKIYMTIVYLRDGGGTID